ncbi:hypothetical protein GCM10009730_42210 [Streptomyces albidochromogenes]|uniref:hypothetical protein n=1 Tax=Streptomyces albidochromogenes TaxID=329524 RepID=UPI00110FE0AC|nr:hypothetical protein [Streptomyces albidochromogenes]
MTDPQYIPGGGWQVAGLGEQDGEVWAEPVIAWEFTNGVGSPVLAEPGGLLVSEEGRSSSSASYWLVPPGQDPATSRYRMPTRS